jgi:hypothetical protein
VGTDFSNSAAAALIEARGLTEGFGPAPIVIHAVTCMAESLWEADAAATHWLDSVSLAAEQVDAQAGSPWLVLVPLRLGSVTARVSLIAPCPVVIVSARESWRSARDSATHAESDEPRREWNG